MELLHIVVHDPSQSNSPALLNKLQSEFSCLHKDDYAVIIRSEHGEDHANITIGVQSSYHRLWREIIHKSAGILAEFMIDFEEINVIRRLIRNEYGYKDDNEIELIEGYCKQFLFSREHAEFREMEEIRRYRTRMILEQLENYLTDHNVINLHGFITFRLPQYVDDLREVIEYALDEYELDKQYQEFISLLQYFVYIQEVKVPAVHLLHEGGNDFRLLNSQLQPISTDDVDASFTVEVLDHNTNYEDVIVSTLITISPQQVFIHTNEAALPIIQTVAQIFEGRVQMCDECSVCQLHARRSK